MGVLHNKNQGDDIHGYLGIFKKILKQELKMRNARQANLGTADPPLADLRDHEFQVSAAKLYGERITEELNRRFKCSETRIEKRFLHSVERQTADLFATFKASAVRSDHLWRPDFKDLNQRRKAIEGMIEILDQSGARPLLKIHLWLKILQEKDFSIFANLFKKLQIGGMREIFVLDIVSRLAINWLETLSRVICEDLPVEMLTKGAHKLQVSEQHNREVRTRLTDRKSHTVITATEANDAATWCQRFVMPAFGAMLSRVLPLKYQPVAMTILNCVANKRLELPTQLLSLFHDNPLVDSMDPGMAELKSQYKGTSENNDLLDSGSPYLKNVSNMMQGILHYTSSLIHAGKQMFVDDLCEAIISKGLKAKQKLAPKIFITSKISSDDSSRLLSVTFSEPQATKNDVGTIAALLRLCVAINRVSMPSFCAMSSYEKSSEFLLTNIEEFNSVWIAGNTMLVPIIKFVFASTQHSVSSRMVDRQLFFANMRRQVLESGGSFWLIAIIQECQARMHYQQLGAGSHCHFSVYSELLIEKPHPALGFFVFEPESAAGLLGYDFAEWIFSRNERYRKTQKALSRIVDMEISETGKPTLTLQLLMGGLDNYKNFLTRVGAPENWRSYPGSLLDLGCLYRPPETEQEARFLLWKKAHEPSSADSFSFNSGNKIMASSAYVLSFRSFTKREKVGKDDWEKSKVSLIYFISSLRLLESIGEREIVTLFPSSSFYTKVLELLEDQSTIVPAPQELAFARHKLKKYVPRGDTGATTSLLTVVRRLWFGHEVPGSRTEHEACYQLYKSHYEWLSDTPDESLQHPSCPFSNHIALSGFISSLALSPRSIEVVTPVKRGLSLLETIRRILKSNPAPTLISMSGGADREAVQQAERSLAETFTLIRDSGLPMHVRQKAAAEVLSSMAIWSSPDMEPEEERLEFLSMSYFKRSMAIIKEISRKETSDKPWAAGLRKQKIYEMMRIAKKGVIGFFTIRQFYADGKWLGPGIYRGEIDGSAFELRIQNDVLKTVIVTHLDTLRKAPLSLREHLEQLGLRGPTTEELPYLPVKPAAFYSMSSGAIGPLCQMDGVPIILDYLPKMNVVDLAARQPSKFTLEITSNLTLRVRDFVDRGDQRLTQITVYSYTPRAQNLGSRTPEGNKVHDFWMANQSVPWKDMSRALKSRLSFLDSHSANLSWIPITVDGEKITVGKETMRLKPNKTHSGSQRAAFLKEVQDEFFWLKKTLSVRAHTKGFKQDMERIDYPEFFREPEPEVDNSALMDLMLDFGNLEGDDFLDDFEILEDGEEFGDLMEIVGDIDLDLFRETTLESNLEVEKLGSVLPLHKFWDDAIKELLVPKPGDPGLHSMLYSKVKLEAKTQLAQRVLRLLGNDGRPEPYYEYESEEDEDFERAALEFFALS